MIFANLCTVSLGLTLFISGVAKLFALKGSTATISRLFRIKPPHIIFGLAKLFPFIEIILGISLIMNLFTFISSIVSLFMISIFAFLNLLGIRSNQDIACNCFGNLLIGKLGWGGLYHTFLLFFFAIIGIVFPNQVLWDYFQRSILAHQLIIALSIFSLFFTGIIIRSAELEI